MPNKPQDLTAIVFRSLFTPNTNRNASASHNIPAGFCNIFVTMYTDELN